jgi:hypothetical protein
VASALQVMALYRVTLAIQSSSVFFWFFFFYCATTPQNEEASGLGGDGEQSMSGGFAGMRWREQCPG